MEDYSWLKSNGFLAEKTAINSPLLLGTKRSITKLIQWRRIEKEIASNYANEFSKNDGNLSRRFKECIENLKEPYFLLAAKLLINVENMLERPELQLHRLYDLLCSSRNDDELQGELFDLLGIENFDLIGNILISRNILINVIQSVQIKLSGESTSTNREVLLGDRFNIKKVEKKSERKKGQRKITEWNMPLIGSFEDFGANKQIVSYEQMNEQLRINFIHSSSEEYLPFVFDALASCEKIGVSFGASTYCLPEGTKRFSGLYEEITVPGFDNSIVKNIEQINVKDMDELGQKGFQNYVKLNVVQSLVFEQTYKTKENLLVCAPTGAGKTNIAMLAILNTIHEHTFKSQILKDEFKIIYLAPMKALAAEMTETFGKRLSIFGLKVRELTGDTVLSKSEIVNTQMLVLTPEKWDVITRKPGVSSLESLVRLMIIDEVHLLHDSRGAVIEAIVARCFRQIEMSQKSVRIIGLSATLPNYMDVARFLKVNPQKGLFFFDGRFRPVPLTQTFIGVPRTSSSQSINSNMDEVCFIKAHEFCRNGHQILIFVHSRNGTSKLALILKAMASDRGVLRDFVALNSTEKNQSMGKKLAHSIRNKLLYDLVQYGFGIHHAGLARHDRNIIEKLFTKGYIKVLVCTATLAWGVNLPAHAVIIKGTDVFDSQRGTMCDLGVLDVQQIFGRAGRPQYEETGHGVIITWKDKMAKYIEMLTRQAPIESQFQSRLYDNLNAEIALGTVSSIGEAVEWLSYTYFFIRANKNPLAYGITYAQLRDDPNLSRFLSKLVMDAAEKLDMNQMIRYDSLNGFVSSTDLGRIASNFYIKFETIEMLNTSCGPCRFTSVVTDETILLLIANASEFSQMKVREEEMKNLEQIASDCPLRIKWKTLATIPGKIYCLEQALISRYDVWDFSLLSEMHFVEQNAGRICRAMFEIALRRGWAQAANACFVMSKCLCKRIWPFQTPIRQMADFVKWEWIKKIEYRNLSFYQLLDMSARELGSMLSCDGLQLYNAIRMLPVMNIDANVKPITNTIIQISITLTPDFIWNERLLGGAQTFWIFVENINENLIFHHEEIILRRKQVMMREKQNFIFTIPIHDKQLSNNYQIRVASDYFVVDDTVLPISMHNCILPSSHYPHTDLLDLDPLPLSVLKNDLYQSIYDFKYFNPIQTQVFFSLFHSDDNLLIGAPTGSGKTLCAELAIFRLINQQPEKKCVYIAPLKALVHERVNDWKKKFEQQMGISVVELTGDHTPDVRSLKTAMIVITTPEKWDGITREWEVREYVKQIVLLIIDEVHLLGVERGSVLEAIITRVKMMKKKQANVAKYRILALSTALANAGDIAEWLDIKEYCVYNFRPNVRPIPVEVHIAGFSGQHYCPRMALMNKPAFKAIKTYSPLKPVLIFVSSRRQTRLTALALVSELVTDEDPRQWLHIDVEELEGILSMLKDENLKLTLPFGIGIHHAGLQQFERNIVEKLFTNKKIQILVATATLAWGINMPAHLVIIKGTEYYDGKTQRYIDFPVTDVLQMIGRAGRPQFDDSAVALIYVQDVKKAFYKRFLYESFPVESSLLQVLPNHVNAEINAGTITTKQQLIEYISCTYLYRRFFANPSYYAIEDTSPEALSRFLIDLVDQTIEQLIQSQCIYINEEDDKLLSTPLGRIASVYYLQHKTVYFFKSIMNSHSTIEDLLKILSNNPEYEEVPVRHNEDKVNSELQRFLPIKLGEEAQMDSPHTKTHFLFQAYFSRLKLQTDYMTDQRSVVEQCIRMLQAMLDIAVLYSWFSASVNIVIFIQMVVQARWYHDHPLLVLPHFDTNLVDYPAFDQTIPMLQHKLCIDSIDSSDNVDKIREVVQKLILDATILDERRAIETAEALLHWPVVQINSCTLFDDSKKLKLNINQDERTPKYIKTAGGKLYRLSFILYAIHPCKALAYSTKFPKEKTAGWLILIGEKDSDELILCRKIPWFSKRKEIRLELNMPQKRGRCILTVVFASDSYLGIDQEYNLHFELS